MQCQHCGYDNPAGTLFCKDCSMPLQKTQTGNRTKTAQSGKSTVLKLAAAPKPANPATRLIVLENMQPTGESLTLPPPPWTSEIILGRNDLPNAIIVDIDLKKVGGYEKMVSRKHISMEYKNGGYSIKDLGSTHGTFINRQKTPPDISTTIADGDEIRMANLIFRFENK